jgi:hypothetical protein
MCQYKEGGGRGGNAQGVLTEEIEGNHQPWWEREKGRLLYIHVSRYLMWKRGVLSSHA